MVAPVCQAAWGAEAGLLGVWGQSGLHSEVPAGQSCTERPRKEGGKEREGEIIRSVIVVIRNEASRLHSDGELDNCSISRDPPLYQLVSRRKVSQKHLWRLEDWIAIIKLVSVFGNVPWNRIHFRQYQKHFKNFWSGATLAACYADHLCQGLLLLNCGNQ